MKVSQLKSTESTPCCDVYRFVVVSMLGHAADHATVHIEGTGALTSRKTPSELQAADVEFSIPSEPHPPPGNVQTTFDMQEAKSVQTLLHLQASCWMLLSMTLGLFYRIIIASDSFHVQFP